MAKQLRFGIRDGQERAATWKLWTESPSGRSEVYLACRGLGGELKASLHDSGEWHIAYSREFFDARVADLVPPSHDRFVERWSRPRELALGLTLAFRVVTPSLGVTSPVSDSYDRRVTWIPNAPPRKATEIDVILTSPGTQTTSWPGHRSMGTKLVGSLPLANGGTAWAVYWVVDMPDLSRIGNEGQVVATFYKGRTRADLGDLRNLRMLVIGTEPDGSRVFYDLSHGPPPHSSKIP